MDIRDQYAFISSPTRQERRAGLGIIVMIVAAIAAASALAGCSGKDSVSVAPITNVTVTPGSPSVTAGNTVTLVAVPTNAAGDTVTGYIVTWTSSDTSVATVNAAGVVTTKKAGTATITANIGGMVGTANLTVLAAATTFSNVFVVGLLETNASSVTAASMPWLDSVRAKNATTTQYFGNTQPSIGNFYMLATGDTITNNDADTTVITADNIVRELLAAGKTWKSYAETIPSVGYLGPDQGLYSRHHNVFVFLSDARTAAQKVNIVPLTQLQTDITANALPNFGMIVPNECHNTHQCSLATVDTFLRQTLTPLIASSQFQANGMLIILFDRSNTSTLHGGGNASWVLVSPRAKAGFSSINMYQHQSTLRLVLKSLGITVYPGAAATAPDMSEFFN